MSELEYRYAVELGLPRLIFLMGATYPILAADVEHGEGAGKLALFKSTLRTEQVVAEFVSPADLRASVINSLSALRSPTPSSFHFVSDMVRPPLPYIAHPYTLLRAQDLVGRQPEINLLTDWVADAESEFYAARVLTLIAMGGMGKIALTWKWFSKVAPLEMKPLAGRLWWSFYESDATFENFVVRALAYVSRIRIDVARSMSPGEREELLLHHLTNDPYLIVLDGLERIMLAYARMDAPRLEDLPLDETPAAAADDDASVPHQSKHSFRKTADPRVGAFLRKLIGCQASRTLISSRLYPAALECPTGNLPGTAVWLLHGLEDDDALTLWRQYGVTGSRDILQPLFRSFENYPLLIRALAGEVKRF